MRRSAISRADIDLARIPVGSNVGGVIFTIATLVIFLIGIPALRSVFPILIAAGFGVAAILHFTRR
jgi:hypothetical protein